MELYRRHSPTCKHKDKGYAFTKCQCPIWVDSRPRNGKPVRKSLGTRNWEQAIRKLDAMADKKEAGHTVSRAVSLYLEDCRARNLAGSTLISYANAFKPMVEFLKPLTEVHEVTPALLAAYRKHRKVSMNTQRKELEQIRGFFWFCVHQHWIASNPAAKIKPPKADNMPTLPYEKAEVSALLAACDSMTNIYEESAARARVRAKALLLLLLYSGFRISDAVNLKRSRLSKDGTLLVRTMKTGTPLYIRLPRDCMAALSALPVESEYFFWSGTADIETAKKSARRTIACLGRMCGINAHPHRFRDTFAVELLLKGTDIRTVQLLLGHASVKTTEKHYAPYVSGFQKMLDDALGKLRFD